MNNLDPVSSDPDESAAQEQPTETSPFAGVGPVDGLVYVPEQVAPELKWNSPQLERPQHRSRPAPRVPEQVNPWVPGPDLAAPKIAPGRARLFALALAPLAALAGLGWLIWMVLQAYGF